MQDIACIPRNDREQDNVIEGRIVSPNIYIERCNVSRCANSKFRQGDASRETRCAVTR